MVDQCLIQLPDIPLKLILKHLDYRLIQVLRKVCRDLRNFIDDVIPTSSIKMILFKLNHDRVHLEYKEFGISTAIRYRFHNKGCIVIYFENEEGKRKRLENEHFVDCFWKDFETMLRHQKSILEEFYMVFGNNKNAEDSGFERRVNDFIENFKAISELRAQKLRVKSLEIEAKTQDQLTLLSHLDADFIEKLAVFLKKNQEETIATEAITELELWKKAKTCGIYYFDDESQLADVIGVTRGKIFIPEKMSAGIVLSAKTEFIRIDNFKYYEFHYREVEGDIPIGEQLTNWIGPPFVEFDENTNTNRSKWFFRIPRSQFALAVYEGHDDAEKCVVFERLEVNEVPLDANMLLT